MKQAFSIITIALLFISCKSEQKKEIVSIDTTIYEKYNLKNANELVLDAFTNSDIVLLGENHFIAEHVNFIGNLIPKLHKNGINILYSEFISIDYSPQIEELINAEKRKAFFVDWEDAWAERVINETIEKDEKALVYCGVNHALTYYRQPILKNGKFYCLANRDRVGQYLYDELDDKCSFFSFHIPWDRKDGTTEMRVNPLNGILDQLIDSLKGDQKAYGFYTKKSELGKIIDTTGYYSNGYPDFSLSKFCDGYLVVNPICDLSICKFIPNFIDSTNIEIVRPQVKSWENIDNISIQRANSILKERHDEKIDFFKIKKRI